MENVSKQFNDAKLRLGSLKNDPGNEAKLNLYAFFKQATVGDCNTSRPGMMDLVGRSKWNAWNQLKGTSKKDAEKRYIQYVDQLLKNENPLKETTSNKAVETASRFTDILVSIEHDCIYKITLNRPQKFNAFSIKMFQEVQDALADADNNPNIKLCVITGAGKYYSSGNDLNNFARFDLEKMEDGIRQGLTLIESFINSLINFKKPLIALVNGPCIGIALTTLAFFDLVIASDKATFYAPFIVSGLSPEGCSSYTFPMLMGRAKACDILLFNRKLTAHDAFERNLVNEIIDDSEFSDKCQKKLETFSKLPSNSLLESKNFIKDLNRETLIEINRKEMKLMAERIKSGDFMNAFIGFMDKKAKL